MKRLTCAPASNRLARACRAGSFACATSLLTGTSSPVLNQYRSGQIGLRNFALPLLRAAACYSIAPVFLGGSARQTYTKDFRNTQKPRYRSLLRNTRRGE